jgi:hypothetical protein
MRDREIRAALREFLDETHRGQTNTLIIPELALCQGNVRIDMAVINGAFNGYEIKSDKDTLERLPHQRDLYGKCFDLMTLVVGSRHAKHAKAILPKWWGILRASPGVCGITLTYERMPRQNPKIDAKAVSRLLWRSEALSMLIELDLVAGLRTKARPILCDTLAAKLPRERLCDLVRERLKARGDWRSGQSPFRCGDSSQSFAKSQRSRLHRQWLLSLESQSPPN